MSYVSCLSAPDSTSNLEFVVTTYDIKHPKRSDWAITCTPPLALKICFVQGIK